MQSSNAPGKLVLPFAYAGGKNAIPVASQIGIIAGKASLTDGFPPLTRTPLSAGGVPPSGLDMNGILYEMSDVIRWANAGGGYPFDANFATNANVGGYPKGARIMRSDGVGYWLNTVENNETDPEAAGAAAAGWVPDYTSGAASVTMTDANVTLTPLEYGKRIIILTGVLTANLNLIFPTIVGEWTIVNNCSGAFSVTCKTATGAGVVIRAGEVRMIYGDSVDVGFSGSSPDVVTVRQFGAKGDGTTDDLAAFNAAIAYANSRTTVGTTIIVPDGQYLISAALNAIVVSDVCFVGSSSAGAVIIAPSGVPLFSFGNGVSPLLVGGGARNLKIKYTGTPTASSIVFRFEYSSRLNFDNLLLENICTLAWCGDSAARFASALTFSNVRGFVQNVSGFSLFNLRFGAGLFLSNNQVFVGGVVAPVHPASMTTAANVNVINCIDGSWDTVQGVNCLFERWDSGVVINATSGKVYQNFYFANCIWDYIKSYVFYINSAAGGVAGTIECANCWYASWEQAAIEIVGAGYNDNHSFSGKVVIAGKEAVNYGLANAKSCKFDLEIGGVNRVATTSNAAMNFIANSTGFIVTNCRGNDDNTAAGFTWRAQYGVKIDANCNNYSVQNNRLTGSVGGYNIAANSAGSASRRVANNISANYAGNAVKSIPASGVRYTNTSPHVEDWSFFGGTITGGYDKNLVGFPGALQYVNMRLQPGDTFAVGYSAAPAVVVFIEP